ncbi:MAG TPA: amino acid adenylation domain-containing protein [Ktedonobacteraceae bacterium]|nr:amino acid adenylation domain-containing protein [Ktedonobacteraceae bacterium]
MGVHEHFAAQARHTPDAIAVCCHDQHLSYAQLEAGATLLAERLRTLGVGPERVVALYLHRSPLLLIALLAVLKAGGAYLPLTPELPLARLRFLLHDSQAQLVLSQQDLLGHLPEKLPLPFLCLEQMGLAQTQEWTPAERAGIALPVCHGEQLAYVIYTSGSSGLPKGVQVSHGNLLHLVAWHRQAFDLRASDRVSQLAGLSFDAMGWEIWPTLLCGACLCLPEQPGPLLPPDLQAWLRQAALTLSFLPTPLAEAVLRQPQPAGLALRGLLTGGDRLHARPDHRWPCPLINNYGPTETTVVATSGPVEPESDAGGRLPTIGRPIQRMQAYVLDAGGQPVPIGVAGELYLAGAGVTRGYLGRAELTAERFVPHPFSQQPGARLYRTGDVVRWQREGTLEFVGRRDAQVQLRGVRIELGEIEAVLRRHQAVQHAVVLLRQRSGGERVLVAYVVGAEGQRVQEGEVRTWLREQVPSYMQPAAIVWLHALPVTPQGKVDRRALPDPWSEQGVPGPGEKPERAVQEGHTAVQEVLAGIWGEVLGVSRVGLDDNFFEVGGHSLLATQVLARIYNVFQLEIPLRQLFEAPTIRELAGCITQVLQGEVSQVVPPIRAGQHEGNLPLSFSQQRLWFLEQWNTNMPLYSIPAAFLLKGALNIVALEGSLTELTRRHETLRARFVLIDGQPVQTIANQQEIELTIVDLRTLAPEMRGMEKNRLTQVEISRPFNLAEGPLLHTQLIRLDDDEHLLLLTIHHIACDGWSMNILLDEFGILYNAFMHGQPSPLPDPPLQYIDFALWQQHWLQGEALQKQLAYWKQQLAGAPALLKLPTDHARPAIQTFRGAHYSFTLPQALAEALLRLSKQEQATLFMSLLAAFAILLLRYSGQEDIVIGTPVANRTRIELERIVGCLINTVVLRINLADEPSFRELLRHVRKISLEAYAHQDLPFEKLVEALQPERNLSHAPLFQVLFALQNASMEERAIAKELTLQPLSVESGTTRFDLILTAVETSQGLRAAFEYSTDLFEESTIRRMAEHWQNLLRDIAANPEKSITRLNLVSESEGAQLLHGWSSGGPAFPQSYCLHQLFDVQAEALPDAIAAVYQDIQISYGELKRRANQLAHYLQRQGVGPEVLVGLCLEHSLEMVTAVLAVLKAGGAFLPLDPGYPQERLAFMANDAQVAIVLTNQTFAARLALENTSILLLDSIEATLGLERITNPLSSVNPENLAYVIYTSGSTGRPKGVMVSHRAMSNRLRWGAGDARLMPADRLLLVASLSFDIAIWELFGPWLAGGCLVIAPAGSYKQANSLLSLLIEQQVTVAHFVPSVLQLLLEEPDIARCHDVRCVLYGGEASSGELASRVFERLNAELHHFYGPTEATINATSWICKHEYPGWQLPIGRPIAGMQVYLLDAYLQPVPIGVVGELYLGGIGLAWGYLHRPELTAERFIPHPYSSEPGARLYRTGDIARWLPDSSIEFMGRRDEQIKLYGYRIEPGEIEAVLQGHPQVKEAVAVLREDVPGDKRLVVYLVARSSVSMPSFQELRRYMQERLPDYMLPSAAIWLERLPLTSNAKVDRKALPRPERLRPAMETGYAPPQTRLEQEIASVWQEVLGLEKVGMHDNFFDLGGYSLLMVRVQSKLRVALNRDVPIVTLFQYPTISALADYFSTQQERQVASSDTQRSGSGDRSDKLSAGKERMKRLLKGVQRDTKISS